MNGRLIRGLALPVFIVSPAMINPAVAANLPLKAPPAPAPSIPTWTGYYVGANAGFAFGQNSTSCSFNPSIAGSPCDGTTFPDLKPRGGLFGLEAGANWQYQSWVVGLAADLSALDVHSSAYFPSVDSGKSNQVSTRFDWLGTTRGRVGYAVGQSLFYGTGGLAYGGVNNSYG